MSNGNGLQVLLLLIAEGPGRYRSELYDLTDGPFNTTRINQEPQYWQGKKQTCIKRAQRFYEDQGYFIASRAVAH